MSFHLHFHSDCDFFAGCENMLANLLNDESLRARFLVTLSYRFTEAYRAGLKKRVHRAPLEQPLQLVSDAVAGAWARRLPRPLSMFTLALQGVLLLRYWILLWNTIILVKAWRNKKIDILHINNGGYPGASSSRAAVIAARLLRIPHVIMVVNNIAVRPRFHERIIEHCLNQLLVSTTSVFITGSRYAGGALIQRLGLQSEKKYKQLHNGIGARQPDESRGETRTRLAIAEDDLVYCVVALLEPRKGHRVLVDAVAKMHAVLPSHLRPLILIEGTGPEEPQLRELVARHQLEDRVRFVGQEKNVFNLMQCADVLVVPSIANEDFPNVVLEAMSLGKAVVASALAGIPEQVVDGVNGWLVPPGDANALACSLGHLAQNREQIACAGARARKMFVETFTADLAVKRYMNLYDRFIENKELN